MASAARRVVKLPLIDARRAGSIVDAPGRRPCASYACAQLVDNANGTVTDTRTGLMWLTRALPGAGEEAKSWTAAMRWANALATAGFDDWRLPSSLEFTTGVPDLLWNSTEDPGNPPVPSRSSCPTMASG